MENRICKRVGCDKIISKRRVLYCSKECYFKNKKGDIPWNKGKTGVYSEEILQKIKEARANQVFSEESLLKRSETMKEFWSNEENKLKMIINNPILQKDKILNEKHKQKIGLGNKGKIHTEEQNLKMSKIRKQQWQNPEYVKKQMKARLILQNKAELSLQDTINSITNSFIFVGDGKEIIGNKCPDFIDKINNKIIELYGDYWHKGQDPNDRINYFKNYGYDTLVIWESELKDIKNVKNKLGVFIYE